jgi:hypothetical protein
MKNIKKFSKNTLKQEYLTIMLIKTFLDEKCCYYNFYHFFSKKWPFLQYLETFGNIFYPKKPQYFLLMKTITLLSAINNNIKYILTPYNKWKHLETFGNIFYPKKPKSIYVYRNEYVKKYCLWKYKNVKLTKSNKK